MKRLLCIVDSLNVGGAETFLMKLYRCLDREKYQMDFIVSDKGYYDDEVKGMGSKIYNIPMRSKAPIKVYRMIKTIVRENGYDRVLKLGATSVMALDLMAAKAGGAKILAARSCNASSDDGKLRTLLNKLLKRELIRITNVKIAPSDLAAVYTFGKKAYDNGEIIMLHNAVDVDKFAFNKSERERIRNEFGIGDAFLIGHVGRLNHQKNHSYLLEIFAEIVDKKPNSRLMLVGKGELYDEINKKAAMLGIADKVIFTGVRSDIGAILSAFDVFVFPSLYEGMPNTVIEAQANGLACIISDTITKEAKILDNLEYLSIEEAPEVFANAALCAKRSNENIKELFENRGYTIDGVVDEFVRIIFERN